MEEVVKNAAKVISIYERDSTSPITLSTESPSTIIGKCDRYRDYYRSGLEQKQFGVFPVVVWLVLDAGRKERLRSAIQEAYPKGGKLFIVITADEFERLIRQGFDAKDLC